MRTTPAVEMADDELLDMVAGRSGLPEHVMELLRRERKRCADAITHSADWCGCEGWCNCQAVIRNAVYQIESLT